MIVFAQRLEILIHGCRAQIFSNQTFNLNCIHLDFAAHLSRQYDEFPSDIDTG